MLAVTRMERHALVLQPGYHQKHAEGHQQTQRILCQTFSEKNDEVGLESHRIVNFSSRVGC